MAVERLDACLVNVKAWLKASDLRLNPTKTQIMWLGSRQQLAKVDTDEVSLLASRVHVLDAAQNLGVLLNSQAVDVGTGFSHVSYWLLAAPAAPALSTCSMPV